MKMGITREYPHIYMALIVILCNHLKNPHVYRVTIVLVIFLYQLEAINHHDLHGPRSALGLAR